MHGNTKWIDLNHYITSHYKVNSKGCWIWNGPIDKQWNRAKLPHRMKTRLGFISSQASRSIYALTYPNKFDPELLVCHGPCNDGLCINPAHMHQGTTKTNAQERSLYGNARRGVTHYISKFTPKDVRLIRKYAEQGITYKNIKKLVGVDACIASYRQVIKRITWKHIK